MMVPKPASQSRALCSEPYVGLSAYNSPDSLEGRKNLRSKWALIALGSAYGSALVEASVSPTYEPREDLLARSGTAEELSDESKEGQFGRSSGAYYVKSVGISFR